ncbi:MAG: ribonuclease E/G, partial [Candidatus Bathyarchaeia archaeon]
IRGIYSTALTKLLLDQGFDIVQPSVAIKERFGLKERDEPPDLDVYDRPDRQGVHALGREEALNAFISTLKSLLLDVIVRRWKVAPEGIYKGLVKGVDPTARSILVDIGPATGRSTNRESRSPKQGCIIVQVEGRMAKTKEPILTTEIKIPGKYAVLVPGRGVKISRKIQGWQARSRLNKLGEELAPPGWGILWRTAASGQSPGTLRDEVINLTKKGQSILERAEGLGAPAALWEEIRFADVEFPALSKEGLDEARGSVASTLRRHHFYKACGGRFSAALEMAEGLLERGRSRGEVESLFRQTVEADYPIEGSIIGVEHVKLD